jgi:Tol biopolymer transport system component
MIGQTISHYRVLRRLGSGGMGEVYEAHDLMLGRHVAIKFLSSAREQSRDSVLRFEREARAASALNHPHICTIHDFGLQDAQPFIVMELLDGQSLRDCLKSAPLGLPVLIELAIQIADALQAAHTAGIIHRDITPANIFATESGGAKVLDFGLAKLTPEKDVSAGLDRGEADDTHEDFLTSPGAALGTMAYMSPEQARAEPLDHRTDLFSFGCVLYEMAAGQRAFQGRSSALVFEAILHATPVAPLRINPALPEALDRLILKSLEKDPALRYQSAREMKADLLRIARTLQAGLAEPAAQAPELGRASQPSSGRPSTSTTPVSAPPESTARLRIARWWLVAAVVVVAAAAGYRWVRQAPDEPVWTSPRQLTSESVPDMEPALSPDGNTVAFTSDDGGASRVWLADAHTGARVRLTQDARDERSPAWYPDGSAVAFVADHEGRPAVWKAPRMPGSRPVLVIENAEEPAVSPDATTLAFVRSNPAGEPRIAVASLPAVNDARVVTGDGPEFGLWEHRTPAWAPDGRSLCYRGQRDLFIVPVSPGGQPGRPRRLTTDDERDEDPVWSSDGQSVLFTSMRENMRALWSVSALGGAPKRLTLGAGPERHPTLSRDGNTLVYSAVLVDPNIVIHDLQTGKETSFGGNRDDEIPAFLPDMSGVVFVSDRADGFRLWVQPLTAGVRAGDAWKLTDQAGSVANPAVSPDGRFVAYYRVFEGQRDIWIVPSVAGPALPFTNDPATDVHPAWSPDGSRIAFVSNRSGTYHVWVAGVRDGRPAGAPSQITTGSQECRAPAWSPDGRSIAFVAPAAGDVYTVPSDGRGTARQVTRGAMAQRVRWNRQTGTLFVSGGWGNAARLALKEVDPQTFAIRDVDPPVTFGHILSLYDFDVSADGRWLVMSREEVRGNLFSLTARRSRR